MRLVLFGATGQIGRDILAQALARGHRVTALVRDPARLPKAGHGVKVMMGDARREADVARAVVNQDAVVNAMGPGGLGTSDAFLDVLTECPGHIVDGMRAAGVQRIVALGSNGTLWVQPGLMLRDTPGFPPYALQVSGAHLRALRTYQESGLAWTVICPASVVEPGGPTGHYRVRDDFVLDGVPRPPQPGIRTGEIAHFALTEVERGEHIGHQVHVAY
ncbi:MAG: SDR family oxidoreductase [Candidatus Nanopelagicales bacterium]